MPAARWEIRAARPSGVWLLQQISASIDKGLSGRQESRLSNSRQSKPECLKPSMASMLGGIDRALKPSICQGEQSTLSEASCGRPGDKGRKLPITRLSTESSNSERDATTRI
eukprot:gb/GFBE01079629.1/.p1 GENE.gb/GFBE01079629.1/~~gb/GFBE01079629.1/.p1  ORF type:complete len:112 (+),score=7.67 gb/GFBE01079629.1/:1-336(+)